MKPAGTLRHRIIIQRPVETQDATTGAISVSWQTVATVWAEIVPMSANEFVASQSMASEVTTRITIRYRSDVIPKMRVIHAVKNAYYNIEGVLPDKDSGMEYLTLPCSNGLNYQEAV